MKLPRCDQPVFLTSLLTSGLPVVSAPVGVVAEVIGTEAIVRSVARPVRVTRAKRNPWKVNVGR